MRGLLICGLDLPEVRSSTTLDQIRHKAVSDDCDNNGDDHNGANGKLKVDYSRCDTLKIYLWGRSANCYRDTLVGQLCGHCRALFVEHCCDIFVEQSDALGPLLPLTSTLSTEAMQNRMAQ